ncbi:hypothetical protein [Oligoflexus sp.]|uniref:hypothetical protein n=1 Tax=Oligoflexus sp. TaxID=1971216 RepID=UPI002D76F93E|nr:hypothetical protein [Oligoflexus sp.]
MKVVPHQIGHFTKLAKQFRDHWKNDEENAKLRAAKCFSKCQEMSLAQAQHIIALEHEFDSWKSLTQATALQLRLAIVMKKEPLLNNFGIGVAGVAHWDDYWATLVKRRADLRASHSRIEETARWLGVFIKPIKTINTRSSSYGLKHRVEREIGYITNGVFIAAAMIAGYPYRTHDGSPNVYFGMSEQSWKPIKAAQQARGEFYC